MHYRKVTAIILLAALTVVGLGLEIGFAPGLKAKQKLIFMTSRRMTASQVLGFYGYPAMVDVGGSRRRGTYIYQILGSSSAKSSGLDKGDVLISINGRIVESPLVADSILKALAGEPTRVVYAKRVGNGLKLMQVDNSWGHLCNMTAAGSGTETHFRIAPGRPRPPSNESIEELEAYLLQLINNDRTSNGNIARVRRSSELSAVARAYAEDMCKRGFTGHFDPEGRSPQDRARAAGIAAPVCENLAFYTDPRASQRAMVARCEANMMAEPKDNPNNHRGQILNPDNIVVGVGVAKRTDGGVMIVQEFSRADVP
ncbi:MAG: hypothetical protein KC777_04005 [Cyanobacteria bacterium HKST-UBA02]|nr:hypothetical protein [Cyanobacteria bacterium HKST-UBA02]